MGLIQNSNNSHKSFDLRKTINNYTKRWVWFLLSCAILLSLAYLKKRYEVPIYSATAKIMLTDEKGSGKELLNDLSVLSSSGDSQVEDEIQVIKSRESIKAIIMKLGLNIQYFKEGRLNDSELYKNVPFEIVFSESDSIINNTDGIIYINILSNNKFEYKVYKGDEPTVHVFGDLINSPFGEIQILPIEGKTENIVGSPIRVEITSVERQAKYLKNSIGIFPSDGNTSKVLDIYLNDRNVSKAIDIINELINQYNLSAERINQKRALNTANFINERVNNIARDLSNVEDSIVRFKASNKMVDISSGSVNLSTSSLTNEARMQELKTQLNMLNYVKKTLQNASMESLPSNLGSDSALSGLVLKYNELLERRKILLKSAGENNSVVIELTQNINSLKSNLLGTINNSIHTLNIQINSIQNQQSEINSKFSSIPRQESRLMSIERRQYIKEQIYLYLLEKREEAEISQTTSLPISKTIDPAYSVGAINTNGRVLYFGALFMGLLIPFMFIYITDLLDTKIHNKEDLENEIKSMTVLGEVPHISNNSDKLITYNDRSILSESFRIIRTNFEFLKRDTKPSKYQNVIFVTSTINGEGKSFVSLNTALTLTNTGKKVLLVGTDLRNPQIFSAIKKDASDEREVTGLSEYLADYTIQLEDVISSREVNGIKLDILLSGQIPPNPAELLMDQRLETLFDTVSENYDYVVVDTAPSMLVTDTLLMHKYSGHTIYVTRAGYTEKRILNFASELHQSNKLNHMMLVVNDVKESNFGYGAKYGYYGAPEKKGFFKRKKKKV
ncbi:GumC family protein [Pseudotamlana agarivorans]|uniref:GumC family protein n=1 Tax=Pseudotamlana agarivorans TaxID=481183 RepID=UPI000833DF2F|nr:tyrosine-protein kinase [Tamlana agarivorans]